MPAPAAHDGGGEGGATRLGRSLAGLIAATGPISLARYMAECLTHPMHGYYTSREPFGTAGDFLTSPEISQAFGELIGLALAELWQRAGSPPSVVLAELGPGRGTLMADLLRAAATVPAFRAALDVHFVEISQRLRAEQAGRVPMASWHSTIETLPRGRPLLVIANEYFDALPISQFVRGARHWHERMVSVAGGAIVPVLGFARTDFLVPAPLRDAAEGSVVEVSPAALAAARQLGERLEATGGAAIIIDYGYQGPAIGDTFQAVSRHGYADPFARPGEADLTAHVDFSALAAAAAAGGAHCYAPVEQGAWLLGLGISERTRALAARATAEQQQQLLSGLHRLVHTEQMGRLFKVMAMTGGGWPVPAGFER